MSSIGRWLATLLGVALALAGCQGDEDPAPQAGSESHFLVDCDMTCAAGLECLCGVCTERCEADSSCQELYAMAECVAVDTRPEESQCPAQDGVTAFCDVRCENDADCLGLGSEFGCDAGFCRQGAATPTLPLQGRIEVEELCDFYVGHVCDIKMQCFDWQYRDREQCLQAQECDGWNEFNDLLASAAISYDAEAAYQCHQTLLDDPCALGFFLLVPELTSALMACGAAQGLLPEGEVCVGDECEPGTDCWFDGACPGVCRRNENLALGEPCITKICIGETEHCSQCAVGLVCANEICRPEWQEGEACAAAIDCTPNLWCNVTAGECQPIAQLGETCSDFRQDAPPCAAGLWCDGPTFETGTCQVTSDAGGPCQDDEDCNEPLTCLPTAEPMVLVCGDKQPNGGQCDSFNDCVSDLCDADQCVPLPGPGESCVDRCQEGYSCGSGSLCAEDRFPGDACDDTTYCQHSRCDAGLCVLRRHFGEACSTNDDCQSSDCIDGQCADVSGCE